MRREGDGGWHPAGRSAAVSPMTVLLRSTADKGTQHGAGNQQQNAGCRRRAQWQDR
jgi:hypothetical protein